MQPPFRIRTGQEYNPRASFGERESISALPPQDKAMLNAKDDDGELCLGKYWKKCIGECVILGAS